MDLRIADLALQTQVPVALFCEQLGLHGDGLPASIADAFAVFFHIDSIAQRNSSEEN